LGNNQYNFQLYTGSAGEKIPQKVLGGYFFDSHCILCACLSNNKVDLSAVIFCKIKVFNLVCTIQNTKCHKSVENVRNGVSLSAWSKTFAITWSNHDLFL